jgi:hypothetical protein
MFVEPRRYLAEPELILREGVVEHTDVVLLICGP